MQILRAITHALAYAAYNVLTYNQPYTHVGPRATIANALFNRIYREVDCVSCGALLGGTTAVNFPVAFCRNCQ